VSGPLVFFVASALVCASATLAVSLIPLQSRLDLALAWSLFASTIVVSTVLLAGAGLRSLAPGLLVALNAFVTGLLLLIWLARGHNLRAPGRPDLARLRAVVSELRGDLWLLLLVAVVIAEVAWRFVIAYVMPPYAGDALWYHLTTVAGWLQAGRIGPSPLTIWSTVHPQNGELLFTWPAVLLGNDTFVDVVQLPYAVVGAIAVAGIGRTVGLSPRGAAAAACLFLLTPIVLSQTTASYTDVIFIAFFLIAFHFLLRFLDSLHVPAESGRTWTVLFLAGLAGGLALGTKALGVLYVGVILVVLVANLLAARAGGRVTGKEIVRSLLIFMIPVLALGAHHYVETWLRFGNPSYPVRIAVFGYELFHGRPIEWFLSTPPVAGSWWQEVWGQWRTDYFFLVHPRFHAYSYDGRPSGLGPLWSYLALPALLLYGVRLARTNRVLFANLLLPVAVMFALQPYRWWSRFTMILVAVGVIAIVALVEAAPQRWSAALKVAVTALVALGVGFPTLKIDGQFWANRVFSVARLPPDERTIGRVAYSCYRWVDKTPPDATIGVDTSSFFLGGQPFILAYPLFGAEFEHRVYSLPLTAESAFRRTLARKRIDYVFVRRRGKLDGWTQRAARDRCARLIYEGHVYAGQSGRAYRIVPDCDWMREAQ
jgi:Dolichyl-phosphate-mannose-protein mannosyltransferase